MGGAAAESPLPRIPGIWMDGGGVPRRELSGSRQGRSAGRYSAETEMTFISVLT